MKVWGGRFEGQSDTLMEAFGVSLFFDARLAPMDALANHAHVRMLRQCGIIDASQADPLLEALSNILAELTSGRLTVTGTFEDVHSWLEAELAARVGPLADNLRLARSRNDLVATDLRLWVRQAVDRLALAVLSLQGALLDRAAQHARAVVPGYTHLQRAQPVTVGHHLMAYVAMLQRDVLRLAAVWAETSARCPLGAGSLATTTWPVQPHLAATWLGFAEPFDNSMDAVSDRDFVLSLHQAVVMTMSHLSRMAEDLILWTTAEFGFATLPDAYSTGSSLMPQKKNPDVLELIRGRAAVSIGHLTGALALLKGLPLTYNRDLQEDKQPLFASVDTLQAALDIMAPFMAALDIHEDRCAAALQDDTILATDLADELVRQGQTFAAAHHQTGHIVRQAVQSGASLAAVAGVPVSLSGVLAQKSVPGGPGFGAVQQAIERASTRLENDRSEWQQRYQKDMAPYETATTKAHR